MAKGDHLKVARWQGLYYHHGLDAGGGEVIHYTGEVASWKDAAVQRDTLATFLDGGGLELCDDYPKLYSPDESVSRAESRLGEKAYSLLGNNCEHFVRWCTTGENLSQQVNSAKQTMTEIAIEGVSRGTQKVLVTFLNSDNIPFLKDLQSGGLQRVGGLLTSAGESDFIHVLRDGLVPQAGGDVPSELLQRGFQMSSVMGAASLINLGVSVAGFAYLAHQMNELQKAMAAVDHRIQEGFTKMSSRFDSVEIRLEEIKWLVLGNANLGEEILAEVQELREELFERDRGRLLAALDMSCLNPSTADDNLRVFKEVRYGLQDGLLRSSPHEDIRSLVRVGGRFRVWSVSAASEGQALLEQGQLQAAREVYEHAAEHAHHCASIWLNGLLDGHSWGMFGHSRFESLIPEERLQRVARNTSDAASTPEGFKRQKGLGAIQTDAFVKRLSDEELHRYVGLLSLVDLAVEVGDRFQSKAKECDYCQNNSWSVSEYLQLGRDAETTIVLSLPAKVTSSPKHNKWS